MRVEFAQAIVKHFHTIENQVFLTGDLGFMALEKVQEVFGEKFINAGVAEQNMISVAAALSKEGFIPWAYSIAPFITLRPYEQIRNDICLHKLHVNLVGNGGGFGYGIMGHTHHNPEDIGAMRLMPNMKICIPFIASDVEEAVMQMLQEQCPHYLRLNTAAKIPYPIPPFSQWRKIKDGHKAVIIGTGPVLGNIFEHKSIQEDAEIWIVSIFPFQNIPTELIENIQKTKKLITIEEHYEPGGLNEMIPKHVLGKMETKISFLPLYIKGYLSGKYGNQRWHLEENNLAGDNLQKIVSDFL
ncbi:MAG: hypothetical protein QM536_09485 [Chitinophagaceae bacterium]|nr:hypothetical protein [Chitinophagaceae bacterium]